MIWYMTWHMIYDIWYDILDKIRLAGKTGCKWLQVILRVKSGVYSKELVCAMWEDNGVYGCSDQPLSETKWKAGLHREGWNVMKLLNIGTTEHIFGQSLLEGFHSVLLISYKHKTWQTSLCKHTITAMVLADWWLYIMKKKNYHNMIWWVYVAFLCKYHTSWVMFTLCSVHFSVYLPLTLSSLSLWLLCLLSCS